MRAVFFVKDAERALDFYKETLGFTVDWTHQEDGKPTIFQVNLFGSKLILNQTEPWTEDRPGHGRVFLRLDTEQLAPFRQHLTAHHIKTSVIFWGTPTLVIRDMDENELFFWLPESERAGLEAELAALGKPEP
jgi:catechol 2,3-dioxygenase-like lactoylglutathione lyase family enzyme